MRYLKTYTKLLESSQEEIMSIIYGVNVIKECDSIIEDIKDILLELSDSGLFTMVGYTPMTLTYSDKTPKIMAEIQGELGLCDSNEDDINLALERVKDYVRPLGFATGGGSWERHNGMSRGPGDERSYRVYQMLIQK
jgi:hypothetical protein